MTQGVGPRGFPGERATALAAGCPGAATAATRSWDELYRNDTIEELPWFFAELDPDLAAALDARSVKPGVRVLDQGTGPGTQAIALAKRGYAVTATDISPAAIAYATRRATKAGVKVDFVVDDVLDTKLAGSFDVIFDRGCFHVLRPEQHTAYVASMKRILAPSSWLFLKTFSHLQPGVQGPHRFTREELRAAFAGQLEVIDIVDTVYQGQLDPLPKAFFTSLRAP